MTTRLTTIGLATVLATTGCDLVYDLERPPDAGLVDGDVPYDRCGPFLYGEPLRYAFLANPNVDELGARPWAWSEARTACLQRGMDLAVFNDAHELGAVAEDPAWPYWMGASRTRSTWSAVDECPAMMPAGPGADACGIVTAPNTVGETTCTGSRPDPDPDQPQVVAGALCETPRPEDGPCLGNDPARTEYVMSPEALAFAAARTFCADRGGRPVVFETRAEWLAVARLVNDELHQRFWIGSTFDGVTWKTENRCPAHYSWATGGPSESPIVNDCMGGVLLEVPVEDGAPRTVLTGVDRADCMSANIHALCEI